MPKPNRLALYADVKTVLDGALAAGGGEYILSTHGEAVHWRQRAYKFRKAYVTAYGTSPYDTLTFPRIEGISKVVQIKVQAPKGIFRPSGPTTNEIDEEAASLARRIFGGNSYE